MSLLGALVSGHIDGNKSRWWVRHFVVGLLVYSTNNSLALVSPIDPSSPGTTVWVDTNERLVQFRRDQSQEWSEFETWGFFFLDDDRVLRTIKVKGEIQEIGGLGKPTNKYGTSCWN
ncbi:unnamed protein product [Ilex paraguariensis]|uniref:Uncharacterized protein n=1 Tax=Ilex paraguariensis TaxID=185542 RepID=A0ABC8UX71_9AQUA